MDVQIRTSRGTLSGNFVDAISKLHYCNAVMASRSILPNIDNKFRARKRATYRFTLDHSLALMMITNEHHCSERRSPHELSLKAFWLENIDLHVPQGWIGTKRCFVEDDDHVLTLSEGFVQ